ncbi:probable formate/nitrite family of transporters [Cephalotrichum gorgonifer]|uniref:Probable formate/nitrite family of transporters n=1 Tax=Cephalotrichum gorgonifer TaxID=2041049 RepID=A0AAE8MTE3_9PEZI|nr:probable formate/nitrite family of transporters [Cephalotrichum gorgonifer]
MSNPVLNIANLGVYTPAETIELVSRAGTIKGNMRPHKVFLSAVSAGCILSFVSGAALCTLTAPWFQANAPGLIRIISALIFPSGFVMIVLTGADLFTGSNMYTAVSVLHGRLSIWKMLLHWFLCFWGNLAGSLFVTFIILGYGGVFNAPAFHDQVVAFVTSKQVKPEWHEIFLRGIGCNWLVALAVFLGMQGRDLSSKIVAMWWPIFAFVALGMDHVVANMCFIPLGIHLGTPGVTVPLYIWKGKAPSSSSKNDLEF